MEPWIRFDVRAFLRCRDLAFDPALSLVRGPRRTVDLLACGSTSRPIWTAPPASGYGAARTAGPPTTQTASRWRTVDGMLRAGVWSVIDTPMAPAS
jgi:hypothetical protein